MKGLLRFVARSTVLGCCWLANLALGQDLPNALDQPFDTVMAELTGAAQAAEQRADPTARLQAQRAQLRLLAAARRADRLGPLIQSLSSTPAWQLSERAFELLSYRAALALQTSTATEAARLALPLRRLGTAELGPDLYDDVQLLLAHIDRELGMQSAALQRLDALLLDARRSGRVATQTRAWLERGGVQVRLFDYAQGLKDYEQALTSAPAWAPLWQARARMGMAQNLNMLNRRPEAFPLLAEALAQFERLGDQALQADALLLHSFFLSKDDRPAEGIAYLRQALQLREQVGDKDGVVNALTHLCGRLLQAGRANEALAECKRGLALSKSVPSSSLTWDVNGVTAEVYAKMGQYEAAYQHAHRSERALLALSKQQLADQTGALRAQFDVDLRRLDNERLTERLSFEERDRQRLRLLIAGLVLAVGLLLVSGALLARLYWRTRHLAEHDALTGLLNRRSLLEWAQDEVSRSQRHGLPLSFIAVDLDHFKRVNDERGHATGDRVLKDVAECLRAGVRREDRLGRLGGEEFLLVLPHTPADEACALAERLRGAVEHQVRLSPDWPQTLSIGVSTWQSGLSLSDCLQAADEALYRAKGGGRNRVVVAHQPPG
ncbi:diguanylate cyclase [Inhella gelatinilytica]|uniref:diguanylate cyclase n=1 Tax=Inhella gelatinilytica TaxID=2795030 RepID=A0A931NEY2_9BURK|nr:diguanylate cyclase [Inhella gelatinilytica]MBH9554179.1 diguanylate cyclase [Inhella gelatinilytica]